MPPFPSKATIRYRLASKRPGRKRPSAKRYSAELDGLEVREEVPEDGGRRGVAGARSIVGRFAAARLAAATFAPATSMVAVWSLLSAGAPQEAQKRPVFGSSVPQELHVDINFPATV